MTELIILFIGALVVYGVTSAIVMTVCKCSFSDARTIIAGWFKGTREYEISRDMNYKRDVNTACEDVLGSERYKKLKDLDKYTSTLYFIESSGYPSVYITLNPSDDNEKIQLQNILEENTRFYLCNYEKEGMDLISEWGQNEILRLPMLIIGYSRNQKEAEAIRRKKESEAEKIIISENTDIYDEDLR